MDVDQIFLVEKILRRKPKLTASGKAAGFQYLVRWSGFGQEADSWEPEQNLLGNVVLEQFQKTLEEEGNKKRGRKRRLSGEERGSPTAEEQGEGSVKTQSQSPPSQSRCTEETSSEWIGLALA